MSHYKNHWLLFILPVLGISFWFVLGFPFADRNESYIWITYLQKYSFAEIIQNPIPSIRSFRPLAQALTWVLYQLSGENSVLIQLVNFILLCAAIWIMIPLMEGAKTFYLRFFYFLIGFIYFSTFYYVFNLHGIFYSPILLIIALFLRSHGVLNNWKWWLFICLILTFFHPLILVFYVAYLSGSMLEKHHVDWKKGALLIIIFAGLFVMLDLLLPYSLFSIINIQNLLGTARNVENHAVIKIFTILLCFLPLLNKSGRQKTIYAGIIAIYAPLALMYNLPFLLLLALLIVMSLVAEGKWSLVGLVLASISFPIVVGSGAPTKASIFIFLLPYLLLRPLSLRQVAMEEWLPKYLALTALAFITFSAVMVRLEVSMPLIASVIRPILVEKGKTHQLEKALMLTREQSAPKRIHFLQEKQANIRDFGQPMTRDNFPPTKQSELDVYQPQVFSHPVSNKSLIWYMSFGTSIQSDTLRLVDVLEEKNCKPAYLYEGIMK